MPLIDLIDCHIHLDPIKSDVLLAAMDRTFTKTVIVMGSSKFTFTLNPADGFTQYHENNLALLKLKNVCAERFEIWPTIDPLAENNELRLKEYLDMGASGLKLYVGHGYTFGDPPKYMFHTIPINSDRLNEVYQMCSSKEIPICLHINTTDHAPGFRDEFINVLENFPKLKILAPHWMLATKRPKFLRNMLNKYPNLFTDTSFGHDSFLEEGMKRISERKDIIKQIILDFRGRILCGSDIVCTTAPFKDVDWMSKRIVAYRQMLSEKTYNCPVTQSTLNGLSLPDDILIELMRDNVRKLMLKCS